MPHILIAGAGYAGLAAYLALRRAIEAERVAVTVVNADDWHLLLPELPLYLAGDEGAERLRLNLRNAVRAPARLVVARIRKLDVANCAVECDGPAGRLEADGLLVALGSVASDFGVPGVGEHAVTIGDWDDAEKLRGQLDEQLGSAHTSSVTVIGGGFTGVEIAAALAERGREEGSGLRVTLVGSHLLPSMPDEIQTLAASALKRLGIRVIDGRAVAVDHQAVHLQDGQSVEAQTVIWAAGVRANPLLAEAGLRTNAKGQAMVDEHLRTAPRVFCAGDCAAVTDAELDRPTSRTAQAALQEGPGAALNLVRALTGRPLLTVRVKERGFLVSLGRRNAAGTVLGLSVHGGEVAMLKRVIERFHAFQVGGRMALARKLQRQEADVREADAQTPVGSAPAKG